MDALAMSDIASSRMAEKNGLTKWLRIDFSALLHTGCSNQTCSASQVHISTHRPVLLFQDAATTM